MLSCKKYPTLIFSVNMVIHALILFCIVSVFYFLVVSKLASKTFETEIQNVIDSTGHDIRKNDKQGEVKAYLKTIDLTTLKRLYARQSDVTENQNSWLHISTAATAATLAVIVVIMIAVSAIFCKGFPIFGLLVENVVLFTLVGCIEVLFFLYIARKFIPVKPSLLYQSFIESLKNNF